MRSQTDIKFNARGKNCDGRDERWSKEGEFPEVKEDLPGGDTEKRIGRHEESSQTHYWRESLLHRGCSICKVVRRSGIFLPSLSPIYPHNPFLTFDKGNHLTTTALQPMSSPLSLNQKLAYNTLKSVRLVAESSSQKLRSSEVYLFSSYMPTVLLLLSPLVIN